LGALISRNVINFDIIQCSSLSLTVGGETWCSWTSERPFSSHTNGAVCKTNSAIPFTDCHPYLPRHCESNPRSVSERGGATMTVADNSGLTCGLNYPSCLLPATVKRLVAPCCLILEELNKCFFRAVMQSECRHQGQEGINPESNAQPYQPPPVLPCVTQPMRWNDDLATASVMWKRPSHLAAE
jgi:hypothetical protein